MSEAMRSSFWRSSARRFSARPSSRLPSARNCSTRCSSSLMFCSSLRRAATAGCCSAPRTASRWRGRSGGRGPPGPAPSPRARRRRRRGEVPLQPLDLVARDAGVGERHPLRGDHGLLGRGGGIGGRALGPRRGLASRENPMPRASAGPAAQLVVGVATGRAGCFHAVIRRSSPAWSSSGGRPPTAWPDDQALLGDLDLLAAALPGAASSRRSANTRSRRRGAAARAPGPRTLRGRPPSTRPSSGRARHRTCAGRPAQAGPRTRRSVLLLRGGLGRQARALRVCALRRSKNASRAVEPGHRASSISRRQSRRRASVEQLAEAVAAFTQSDEALSRSASSTMAARTTWPPRGCRRERPRWSRGASRRRRERRPPPRRRARPAPRRAALRAPPQQPPRGGAAAAASSAREPPPPAPRRRAPRRPARGGSLGTGSSSAAASAAGSSAAGASAAGSSAAARPRAPRRRPRPRARRPAPRRPAPRPASPRPHFVDCGSSINARLPRLALRRQPSRPPDSRVRWRHPFRRPRRATRRPRATRPRTFLHHRTRDVTFRRHRTGPVVSRITLSCGGSRARDVDDLAQAREPGAAEAADRPQQRRIDAAVLHQAVAHVDATHLADQQHVSFGLVAPDHDGGRHAALERDGARPRAARRRARTRRAVTPASRTRRRRSR